LKARFFLALSALGLAAGASPASLEAQATRTADPNAPRLMVGVFRSAEKNVGVQTADAIRTRINQDVPLKQLWVIPKQDITATLEASGFPTTEALAAHDARALAQLLRADAYIVGNVAKDSAGTGYVVNAQYVLTRDQKLVQPLPAIRVDKPDKAAGAISKEFREAHKQFLAERSCTNLARENKFTEAAAAARRGIADYPNATLARLCLANALKESKAPNEQILAVVDTILKIDPRSQPALALAYDAYKAGNKEQEATDVLLRLVAADPTNTRNLEAVINSLAGSGQAAKAVPFVDQLVRDNPGDPGYVQLQMRVHLAAKDYKGGIAAGEELMKLDTAAANVDLFTRLAAAAQLDSQPQRAAEIVARGVAKFPTNTDLQLGYADILRRAGQPQQALEALNKVIAANPKAPGIYTSRAQLLVDMNQPDSALASLQAAVAAGDSATNVARYALSIGQTLYRAAGASKARADYERAVRVLEFSDKTSGSDEAKFLLGATSLSLGQTILVNEVQPVVQKLQGKSRPDAAALSGACENTKAAQAALNAAQINLPAGGKFNPQATQQLLGSLAQLAPYADQVAKAVCK
jgi:tetratricopeptide (TPR) repeat protein